MRVVRVGGTMSIQGGGGGIGTGRTGGLVAQ